MDATWHQTEYVIFITSHNPKLKLNYRGRFRYDNHKSKLPFNVPHLLIEKNITLIQGRREKRNFGQAKKPNLRIT